MSVITLQPHSDGHFNPEVGESTDGINLQTLEALTLKASKSGSWTKFKIKVGENGETKQFRVKVTSNENGTFTTDVQRNNWKAFFCRVIGKTYYDPEATKVEVEEKVQAANDLFSKYATSLKRINTSTTARTARDFIDFRRAGSDMQAKSANGYTVVVRPSVYINKRFKDFSTEKALLVLDLDETLSLDRSYATNQAPKDDNLELLDSGIKAAIEKFKQNRPNGEVILVTKSPKGKEGKIDEKLATCSLSQSDFTKVYARDPENQSERRMSKKDMLSKAVSEFTNIKNGKPETLVFCDDQAEYLMDGKEVCKENSIPYEGVRIHSARPYKAVKSVENETTKDKQLLERMDAKVSEQEVYKAMSAAERHNHLMLTHKFTWG